MDKLIIEWVEVKGPDWKQLTIKRGNEKIEATVNRTSKKGDVFPNFDALAPGMEVNGVIWTSPAGKNYLFPPRPSPMGTRPAWAEKKTTNIEKVMDKKDKSIEKFQDNKDESIKISSTMRDAVSLAIAEEQPTEENINKWRQWLWHHWDDPKEYPPFG